MSLKLSNRSMCNWSGWGNSVRLAALALLGTGAAGFASSFLDRTCRGSRLASRSALDWVGWWSCLIIPLLRQELPGDAGHAPCHTKYRGVGLLAQRTFLFVEIAKVRVTAHRHPGFLPKRSLHCGSFKSCCAPSRRWMRLRSIVRCRTKKQRCLNTSLRWRVSFDTKPEAVGH